MSKKIAVIGGDVRQITVGKLLEKDGYNVLMYGFDKEYIWDSSVYAKSLAHACEDAGYILLGLPASTDGVKINTPCGNTEIYIDELTELLGGNTAVIGGRLSPVVLDIFGKKNIRTADYFEREELIVQNAIPTAEGAISIAMQEIPFTLHGSKCLVAGYGRIGKVLSKMLCGIGADVSCSARKHSDLAWISSNGYIGINNKNLIETIHEYQIIFNTVPHKIFDRDLLKNMRSDVLIIDLASKPGGVDFVLDKVLFIKIPGDLIQLFSLTFL